MGPFMTKRKPQSLYRFLVLSLSTALSTLTFYGFAAAASFDCKQAKTPRERLICSEPDLSALDDQLGHTYEERKAVLSSHGAELLHQSQVSWLRYLAASCPVPAPASGRFSNAKTCLLGIYHERLSQLSKVGETLGPFVFNRIDSYRIRPAPESTGEAPGVNVWHVAYPQIDNPKSPQAIAWNKLAEKHLAPNPNFESDDGDIDTEYKLGFASNRVISVQWTDSTYRHGARHGSYFVSVENEVLDPEIRALTEADLFGKDVRWVPKLERAFWEALIAKGWKPAEGDAENVKDEIGSTVIMASEWLLTKDGIEVAFSAYEGGCYACNPGPVTVSWAKLKALLSPNAVAP